MRLPDFRGMGKKGLMACTCLSALGHACLPRTLSCVRAFVLLLTHLPLLWSHPQLWLCIYPALFSSVPGSLRNAGGLLSPEDKAPAFLVSNILLSISCSDCSRLIANFVLLGLQYQSLLAYTGLGDSITHQSRRPRSSMTEAV